MPIRTALRFSPGYSNQIRSGILAAIALACGMTLLTSCASASSKKPHGRDRRTKAVITDGIGRKVELIQPAERIISLAPNVTELIYLLGAGQKLIGVTTHCNWPDAARGLPKIGDLLNPNYELILAAGPDLVIGSTAGNDRAAILKLADLGVPVYVTAARSVKDIFESVTSVGGILECASKADMLVAQMESRLEAVKSRLAGLPRTRAFFITWFDPLLAPGKNTFENDVLREIGLESLTAGIEEFYPRFSLEQLIHLDPDELITVDHTSHTMPDLKGTPGWQHLRAVRRGRVYILDEVFQHPSPRFVDGVEQLARKMVPEPLP